QLPSIGAGNVLRDILDSKVFSAIRLNHIFRQAKQSMIIVNAHRIQRGEFPFSRDNSDFIFYDEAEAEKITGVISELVSSQLPHRYKFSPIDDIQVLSPMRKTVTGVDNLNIVLQEKLNPASAGKTEIVSGTRRFRLGDKVMQTRNNYMKLVFNGDIGRILSIDSEEESIVVVYPDGRTTRSIEYELSEMDELVLAYAVSVHKSQGSEYRAVVMPFSTQHYLMLQRNLLYTAVTRAKELVVLVGTKKAVAIAVRNNKTEKRYTGLKYFLAEEHPYEQ
ncbi:MAG: ATP-binding domain-containing protein, partial [bacterium]|nr:ATP-binding domain-containing protein [bacterium]